MTSLGGTGERGCCPRPSRRCRKLSHVVGVNDGVDVWVEWLEHYVGHCRAQMRTPQLNELASALSRGVSGTDALSRAVSPRTAEGGRQLVDFLAGVDDTELRDSLRLRAMTRLRLGPQR